MPRAIHPNMPDHPEDKDFLATIPKRNERNRYKKRLFIHRWKRENGCANCDESESYILDLHHRDPATKNERLKQRHRSGFRVLDGLSWSDLFTELSKVDVLCANCHRREEFLLRAGGYHS